MEKRNKLDSRYRQVLGVGSNLYAKDLETYIDHLEAELKKKDEKIKEWKGLFQSAKKSIKEQQARADKAESTLYSEKQLQQAIKDGFNSKEWLRLPVSMDYPTYKEEQEQ